MLSNAAVIALLARFARLPMPIEKRAKVDREAGQYRQRAQCLEQW
jgi:hypothetical protein